MEALVLEVSEFAILQLGGDYDHSKETPWKAVGKYEYSKTRKNGEDVILAARNLVDLEQVIKGADEVRGKNRGDDLESEIKEDRGKIGDNLETVGQEDFFKSVDQEDLEKFGQEDSVPPKSPTPTIRSQRTVDQEDLETVEQEDSAPPAPPSPTRGIQQKAVLLNLMLELGLKSRRKKMLL